ncbi:hypothetical protein BBP40_005169 [Aspergillus hancockii]|nr:hypothetical protein BBP40_005169 [Aspergillus hancockii]
MGATLRFNLDPDETVTDATLIQLLRKTRLWNHFRQLSKLRHQDTLLSGEALLDLPMSSLPPLSVGQLQLLSLSRALALAQAISGAIHRDVPTPASLNERRPILLLDEATSAIDPDTEGVMQDVIEEFTHIGYTVVFVIHRVSIMMKRFRNDLDAVVWMNEGRIERVAHTQEDAGLEAENRDTQQEIVPR